MPVVAKTAGSEARSSRAGLLFSRCGNPRCATGWMRLWRSRRAPGFEGRWACSAECMAELVRAAVQRESEESVPAPPYRHRIPLGLLLLEQGQITQEQLSRAIEEQRQMAGSRGEWVRLGEWLVERGVLREEAVARTLGAQWGSPVVRLEGFRPAETAAALPQFLAEALGALPAWGAGGRSLCLAFSHGVDRSLNYAVERMTGLPVTAAVARDSEFRSAHAAFLAATGPRARFLEAATLAVLGRTLTKLIESERPAEARLVRVHGWYWVRLFSRIAASGLPAPDEVEDMLCTAGPIRPDPR
jgi:hypothetical protein